MQQNSMIIKYVYLITLLAHTAKSLASWHINGTNCRIVAMRSTRRDPTNWSFCWRTSKYLKQISTCLCGGGGAINKTNVYITNGGEYITKTTNTCHYRDNHHVPLHEQPSNVITGTTITCRYMNNHPVWLQGQPSRLYLAYRHWFIQRRELLTCVNHIGGFHFNHVKNRSKRPTRSSSQNLERKMTTMKDSILIICYLNT